MGESNGAAPAAPGGTRWGQVAAGCLLGCAGLIVLLVLGGFAMVRWATRPSELYAEDALLASDARAYLVASADLADPGTSAFVDALVRERGRPGQDKASLGKAFPLRLSAALLGNPPVVVGALGLSRYANLLSLSLLPARLGAAADECEPYRDEILFFDRHRPTGPAVAILHGSIVLGSGRDGLKRAVDLLKDRSGGQPPAELRDLWPAASGDPIKAVATNHDGTLVDIARRLDSLLDRDRSADPGAGPEAEPGADPLVETLGPARGAWLTARFGQPTADAVAGRLEIVYPDEAQAAGAVAGLDGLGHRIGVTFSRHDIDALGQAVANGDRVVIEFHLSGLARAIGGRSIELGPVKVD